MHWSNSSTCTRTLGPCSLLSFLLPHVVEFSITYLPCTYRLCLISLQCLPRRDKHRVTKQHKRKPNGPIQSLLMSYYSDLEFDIQLFKTES